MPSNCLNFACYDNAIPTDEVTASDGWSLWCKNNTELTTLSWAHLARAVVFLVTATTGRRNLENTFRTKAEQIVAGGDLLCILTGINTGVYTAGKAAVPADGDILICGTTIKPHYVRRINGAYVGQPSTVDVQFPATVSGNILTQETDNVGGKATYSIIGYFR